MMRGAQATSGATKTCAGQSEKKGGAMRLNHIRFWIAVLTAVALAAAAGGLVDNHKYGHAVFFGLGSQLFARFAAVAAAKIFGLSEE